MAGLASVALLAAGAAMIPWLQAPERASAVAPAAFAQSATPPVAVGPAHGVAAPGRVEPRSEPIELGFSLIGQVKAVYVAEGDAIHNGQVLAELDNGDLQARTDAGAATVALRQAELDKLMNGARPEERRGAAARLEEAEANLAYAKREVERTAPLAVSGAASRQAMDQAQAELLRAQARRSAVAQTLALLEAPPRGEDVVIAQANLALAQANLAEQQALLEKTRLRAPIDGIVLRRHVHSGEAVGVTPPTPIVEIGDTSRLRVRAEIDETDIARIAVGERIWITADAYPSRRFGGVVAKLGQRVGRKTIHLDDPTDKTDRQTLEALIDLDPDVHLPAGLRVDVMVEPAAIAKN